MSASRMHGICMAYAGICSGRISSSNQKSLSYSRFYRRLAYTTRGSGVLSLFESWGRQGTFTLKGVASGMSPDCVREMSKGLDRCAPKRRITLNAWRNA